MKQTAVEELIEYFVKQQKEGCSHWCIHDLIAQLYVAKEMEKKQIMDAWLDGTETKWDSNKYAEQYYKQTFKSE